MKTTRIFISLVIFIMLPVMLFAHGINAEILSGNVIAVKFSYDGGAAMKNAAVKIFAPDNYEHPSISAATNEQGMVYFVPTKKGEWILMAKDDGGHIKRVNIPVDESKIAQSSSHDLTYLQKIIIAICVVWGFIGTALFFKSRKNNLSPPR